MGKCEPVTIATGLYFPSKIAVGANAVFFTDKTNGTIFKVTKDGSGGPAILVKGLAAVDDLAATGSIVFWRTATTVSAVADSGGTPSQVILGTSSFTLTPTALFWIVQSTACTCMNGGGIATSCSPSQVLNCVGACTCAADGKIMTSRLDGTASVVLTTDRLNGPITVNDTTVFTTREAPAVGNTAQQELLSLPITGGSARSLNSYRSELGSPVSMFADTLNVYIQTIHNFPGGRWSYAWSRTLATGGAITEMGSGYGVDAFASDGQNVYALVGGNVVMFPRNTTTTMTSTVYSGATGMASDTTAVYVTNSGAGTIGRVAK